MPRIFTLDTLVARSKEMVEMENQDNISLTIWKAWIGTLNGKLQGIVTRQGFRYFEAPTPQTIATTGATNAFAVPADHLATTTVTDVVSSDDRRRLRRSNAQRTALWPLRVGERCTHWDLAGQNLLLGPFRPPAGQTFEHAYVAQPPDLTAAVGSTPIDVVTQAGEDFILHGVAVKALMRIEKDPRDHIRERDTAAGEIADFAQQRAILEGHRTFMDDGDWDGWWSEGEYNDRTGYP